ncbi:Hypothetical protein CINCED_3A024300 [Cinara cedri]|uniref:Uncharacterized protein n=1 Tax=Cinara cedri TaxID=506608 RepID=A0A5E4M537_9HEMI|nr:Hypothetical protein CINCED_3A024300 [Cinara cedri]
MASTNRATSEANRPKYSRVWSHTDHGTTPDLIESFARFTLTKHSTNKDDKVVQWSKNQGHRSVTVAAQHKHSTVHGAVKFLKRHESSKI